MGLRTRRFVAMLAALAFLAFYIWAVVAIAGVLPDNQLIDLIFYAVAGLAWGVPLFPLLSWAEGGKGR